MQQKNDGVSNLQQAAKQALKALEGNLAYWQQK
jgi:hypothetical protein